VVGGCVLVLGGMDASSLSALRKGVATLRRDGKWDEILVAATELAMELDIDTVVHQEERKKESC